MRHKPVQKKRNAGKSDHSMKARLQRRYKTLQTQIAGLGPLSQGSVASYPPNSWRWTFKVRAKTACVALSAEQAAQMQEAIANHRKLEAIVQEMREITQTLILETVPGVPRRKPISKIPKAR
jgi:hypothetical protein